MKPIDKKSLSIGVDTHRKIAIASAQTGRDMYELIDEAWRLYESRAANTPDNQELSSTPPPKGPSDKSESGVIEHLHGSDPTEKEMPWLSKALTVLRSTKPGLAGALKSNLIQFEDAAKEWHERQGGQAAAPRRAGQSTATGRKHSPLAAIGRSGGGIDALLSRVDQTLDEIEEAQKRDDKGKGRAPGKTG